MIDPRQPRGRRGTRPCAAGVSRSAGARASLATASTERGMVAVETAFAVVFLAVIGGFVIAVAGVMFLTTQCQVTADEVARQVARGDRAAVARAGADAPAGARVTTREQAGVALTEVSLDARIGPVVWPIRAQARVLAER